jgi:hypothetical protein
MRDQINKAIALFKHNLLRTDISRREKLISAVFLSVASVGLMVGVFLILIDARYEYIGNWVVFFLVWITSEFVVLWYFHSSRLIPSIVCYSFDIFVCMGNLLLAYAIACRFLGLN